MVKREGLKVEKWVKNLLGGILVPASGAIHASLDIRSVKRWDKEFLLEVKMTTKNIYKLTMPLWQKIKSRAEIRMMHPALCVVFKTKFGKRGVILFRREDAPEDFPIDRTVENFQRSNSALDITPTDETLLVKWRGEELVIMPLIKWRQD